MGSMTHKPLHHLEMGSKNQCLRHRPHRIDNSRHDGKQWRPGHLKRQREKLGRC